MYVEPHDVSEEASRLSSVNKLSDDVDQKGDNLESDGMFDDNLIKSALDDLTSRKWLIIDLKLNFVWWRRHYQVSDTLVPYLSRSGVVVGVEFGLDPPKRQRARRSACKKRVCTDPCQPVKHAVLEQITFPASSVQ